VRALARASASLDRSDIDVQQRQARIGGDPQAIAAFVQTHIRDEPYSGAVRGARGTLLAGAGNSLDRALLLAEMLRAAGHRVRFATATLSPVRADALVRAAVGSGVSRPASRPAALEALTNRAFAQFMVLGNALDQRGFHAPVADGTAWMQAVEHARQHAWVQIQSGQQWIDVDPLPGVPYGQSVVAAERTADELDPALFQTLDLGVELETFKDGKHQTNRILTSRKTTASLAGLAIGLIHERDGRWATPVLLIGHESIKGTRFEAPSASSQQSPVGSGMPDFAGLFETRPSPAETPTAEWLHVRVDGPGGPREAVYTIFDTIGPAARRSGSTASLPPAVNADVSRALDVMLGVAVFSGGIPPALVAALIEDIGDRTTPAGVAQLLSVQGFAFGALRAVAPASLLDTQPLRFIDAANVVVSRGDERQAIAAIDLTLKSYRLLREPADPLARKGAFYDALSSGVLDMEIERQLLDIDRPGENVALLVELAEARNVDLAVSMQSAQQPAEHLTPDGRERLAADIARGRIAIYPRTRPDGWSGSLGWWSIDATNGWTEDTTEQGRHQAEYAGRLKDLADRACRIAGVGAKTAAAGMRAAAVTALMHGDPGAAADLAHAADGLEETAEACRDASQDRAGGRGRGGSAQGSRPAAGAGGGPNRPPEPPPSARPPGWGAQWGQPPAGPSRLPPGWWPKP
jgi:hypothetical protein